MSAYYCKYCGRKITTSDQVAAKKTILEIPGYACTALLLRPGSERLPPFSSLEHRNDEILPEVWSCCRISAMRSLRDNPDGGPLVYSDSLLELPEGEGPPLPVGASAGQSRRLGGADFDSILAGGSRPENSDKLYVVKFTALWCPPCRAMEHVFAKLGEAGGLPGAELFEVDADVEQELADRFLCPSLPYLLFFRGGERLDISRVCLGAVNGGGYAGSMPEGEFRNLCARVRESFSHG